MCTSKSKDFSVNALLKLCSSLGTIQIGGACIGSVMGGILCEMFGRKMSMIIDDVIMICGAICVGLAPNAICLYVGEFLVGYINGTQKSSILAYTSEICEPKVRKFTEIMYTMYSVTGTAIAFLLGIFFSYRQIFDFMAVVGVIHVFLLFLCPESPTWLITKGKVQKATSEMMRLRNNTIATEAEIANIQNIVRYATVKKINASEIKGTTNYVGWCRNTWAAFHQETFIRPFLVLIVLFPVGRILTGGPSLKFYMIQILKQSELPISAFEAAAVLAGYNLVVTIGCSLVAVKLPRRPLLIYSSLLMAIGSLGFGTILYFDQSKYYALYLEPYAITKWIPIVALALIFTGQNGGFKLATNIYMGQLLPARTRSLGLSFINFLSTLLLCIEITLTPYVIDVIGIYGMFWFFAAITIFIVIFSHFCVPEVFQRSLQEIENHYRKKSKVDVILLTDVQEIMTQILWKCGKENVKEKSNKD